MTTNKPILISIPISTHDALLKKAEMFDEMLQSVYFFKDLIRLFEERKPIPFVFLKNKTEDLIRRAEELK